MPLLVETDGTNVKIYHYIPSEIAGYIFVSVFGTGALVHIFYMFRFRATHFIPFIIGAIMESGGYYGRVWGHREPTKFKAFILQAILLLIAPIFFAATIYMTLGRIICALEADHHSSIRPRWLTKLFLSGDILCFIVQIGGVGMQVTTDKDLQQMGVKVSLGGLILQLFVFAWFLLIAILFHRRLAVCPTPMTEDGRIGWRKYFVVLYLASLFILVRNIVRIFEYAQGFNGFIMKHEIMLYLFDASLMASTVLIYVLIHPGRLVRQANRSQVGKLMGDTMPMVESGAKN